MRLATLKGVDVGSKRFTYNLDFPHYHSSAVPGISHESRYFEVFSREGFTKVWSAQHRELIKTLGVTSHSYVLEELGYIRAVDLGFVQDCTDKELLTCLQEFEKTGDDIHAFKWELGNR